MLMTLGEPTMTTVSTTASFGWLRNPQFDLTLIVGVAAVALASGAIVVAEPTLFPIVLVIDLWLLGYQHVVSTFTRLTFDSQSFREHRFLIVVLPFLVLAGVIAGALAIGGWLLATTYLYWQWFHYTRQSYGIERAYRGKAAGGVAGDPRLGRWALYLLPLWGILYRSYQAPERFLGFQLKTLPVPAWLVWASGVLALAVLAAWCTQVARACLAGHRLQAHTLYVASHSVVFAFGYLLIDNIDHGWLVINVWHNAQYILFVWMYNTNRFRDGVDTKARLLSYLSQRRNWPLYFFVCLAISSIVYFGLEKTTAALDHRTALPLFLVVYQAINFHHYLVDGLIWKMRKPALRKTLGVDTNPA